MWLNVFPLFLYCCRAFLQTSQMSPDVFSSNPKQASKSVFDCTLRNEVLWAFFPHIMHLCFDLSTICVMFTITSTHKRENKFVCTAICAQLGKVAGVLNARFVQVCTSGYTHQNSKLTHLQTECPYALPHKPHSQHFTFPGKLLANLTILFLSFWTQKCLENCLCCHISFSTQLENIFKTESKNCGVVIQKSLWEWKHFKIKIKRHRR